MVKSRLGIAVLVLFTSNLLLASKLGFNWLNITALILCGLTLTLQAVGGRHGENIDRGKTEV